MYYFDFSNYPLSYRFYGGSERKTGILFNGAPYMLKFRKKTPFGIRFNTISEYLGSHIYQYVGIVCQDTYLGSYRGEEVVACADFLPEGSVFVPFNGVGESTLDEDIEHFQYSYDDILLMLKSNRKLTSVDETIDVFFQMYIVDALIGNFDRHGANWGFLKSNGVYRMAPVFDNGSCLFPNLINDDDIVAILADQSEIDERVFAFPTSQIKLNGKKSSYYEVINSLEYPKMNHALRIVVPRIDLSKIYALIEEIPSISETRKVFYKTILEARYSKILRPAYEKLEAKR